MEALRYDSDLAIRAASSKEVACVYAAVALLSLSFGARRKHRQIFTFPVKFASPLPVKEPKQLVLLSRKLSLWGEIGAVTRFSYPIIATSASQFRIPGISAAPEPCEYRFQRPY